MRLIDADALKELILKERDAIPKTVVERYSFGAEIPNSHGNLMRGGIRKALRCMEQTPTIDPETLRPKGRWEPVLEGVWNLEMPVLQGWRCSECGRTEQEKEPYCNCGAKMEG